MAPPTIYFVRHGETAWNVEGRLQGQRDIPINDVGREQAAEAGRRLQGLVPDAGALVWQVSPLDRTCETAEIARAAIGLPPKAYRLDDQLKELTFGDWEGLTWGELRQRDPRGAAARRADKWGYAPPRGESYAMLRQRVEPWVAAQSTDTVVVSHGGVARVLLVMLAGKTTAAAAEEDIHQGRVLVLTGGTARWV